MVTGRLAFRAYGRLEYGAWMPVYWEALKTTFVVRDKEEAFFDMAKYVEQRSLRGRGNDRY